MNIDMTGGGGGFKIKKGILVFGILLEVLISIAATPLFIFTDEIEKALSIPPAYSGAGIYRRNCVGGWRDFDWIRYDFWRSVYSTLFDDGCKK